MAKKTMKAIDMEMKAIDMELIMEMKAIDMELIEAVDNYTACPKHKKYTGKVRPRVQDCAGCWEVYLFNLWMEGG